MSNLIIEKLLAKTQRTDIPAFRPGDTVLIMGARDPALPGLARRVYATLSGHPAPDTAPRSA